MDRKIFQSFQDLMKKYFIRNKKYLFSENVVHEMNAAVLTKTSHAIFDFYGTMVDEVSKYCKEQGYDIDKIVFVSSYDIEVVHVRDINVKMKGESKIRIIEEDNKTLAVVCMGEYIHIQERRKYD